MNKPAKTSHAVAPREPKRAGVKSADGAQDLERRNVMLDAESIQVLERIGLGNLSLGTREAVRRLKEANDTLPFSQERHANRSKTNAD